MASYETTVRTPLPPTEAFEYMADLRNFAEWDPGVRSVEQVVGNGAGPDAAFNVVVDGAGRGVDFRYETVDFDRPESVTVEASTRMFTSRDRIDVEAVDRSDPASGSVVRYRAELKLNGPLGFVDPLLRPFFNRIAGRADAGLQRVLGEGS
jgi:carbon monoxide dehydrogenase subunit G